MINNVLKIFFDVPLQVIRLSALHPLFPVGILKFLRIGHSPATLVFDFHDLFILSNVWLFLAALNKYSK